MKMTGAGDRMLDDKIEEALDKTASPLPPIPSEGVCKAHPGMHSTVEGIREGTHVLLLCRQEDRKNGTVAIVHQKQCKLGPFTFKGFDAADILKIGLVAIIGIMLVGDKVWSWYNPSAKQSTVEQNVQLNEQQIGMFRTLAHQVAKELIDKTVEERERKK